MHSMCHDVDVSGEMATAAADCSVDFVLEDVPDLVTWSTTPEVTQLRGGLPGASVVDVGVGVVVLTAAVGEEFVCVASGCPWGSPAVDLQALDLTHL